mmetsp:Transcript_18903/g.29650  ORF Transcript_18903/g.29650 Transcript_18903/m.29650 type:complete len:212 (-) Transcript_18903:44-679(-)|eukprot:CAMPEP_0201506960 /NCGR_PEP_ID=MMETSP0161_2-20130828/781_1 /ASSEMBLY_ACC=CAM_ASM_000251 /TAXON_ID=180227 /ORGANISM="Neoparamoeba aestuarina, Strain SoJaBio B1-5/56/2" /LENGTH=211 /DNA_ID=CAMNT_0047901209 /DNA_START=77 /DNA_END=712 /DNA_ORIENTATION=+
MLNTIKKTTGLGVTKVDPTVDEEYNALKRGFKEINVSCQALAKALKEQKRAWQQMADLTLKTTEAAKKAGDEGSEIFFLSSQIHDSVAQWKNEQIDQDASLVEPLKDIEAITQEFKDTNKCISKREDAVKELDFRRGELEKASKSTKDREAAMAKVHPHVENAQTAYDTVNNEAKERMKELLAKKEHLYPLFLRAYVHANSRLARSYPQFD